MVAAACCVELIMWNNIHPMPIPCPITHLFAQSVLNQHAPFALETCKLRVLSPEEQQLQQQELAELAELQVRILVIPLLFNSNSH